MHRPSRARARRRRCRADPTARRHPSAPRRDVPRADLGCTGWGAGMTTTTFQMPSIGQTDRTAGVPMTRLVRVELRKLVDTRAGAWLLAAIALVTVAAVGIYLFASKASGLTFAD